MAITLGTDGYCAASDVASHLSVAIDSSSDPTDSEVEEFIKERAIEINAVLEGIGISTFVPTSSTAASTLLKRINIVGASLDTLAAKERAAGSRAVGESRVELRLEWRDYLRQLARKELSLIDETGGVQEADERRATYEFNLDTNSEELDPLVDRATKF